MNLDDKVKTWFGTMTFDSKHCFLCGELLDKENTTFEHIFPKWLQHKHELWDQTLILPNGTPIKYKQLIVPCCNTCNNKYLSVIENEVKKAFVEGIEKIREIDKTIFYKWVMKILYCLLYKELSLKEDRKSKDSKMIITPEFLKNYRGMFDYMQSIRGNVKINEDMSSIFIFNILTDNKDDRHHFFYADDILHAQLAVQSNNIGIICCLGESEAMKKRFAGYFKPFYKIRLHPIQFRQLIAEVFYNRTLLNNRASTIMTPNEIIQVPPFTYSYDKCNYKEYAKVLLHFLEEFGFEFENLYSEELDAALNLLIDENKRIIIYDEDGKYHFGEKHDGYKGEIFQNVEGCVTKEV